MFVGLLVATHCGKSQDAPSDDTTPVGTNNPPDGSDPTGPVSGRPVADCITCHGDETSAAPPKNLNGETALTSAGVGAHRVHLRESSLQFRRMLCTSCHIVPEELGSPGHLDEIPGAEVTFGEAARWGNAQSSFANGECSNVYCHGSTLSEGGVQSIGWIDVGQAAAACGTCHGVPPRPPHPTETDCGSCHPTMDGPASFSDPALHINGTVEIIGQERQCNSCHGDSVSPAPPKDLGGGVLSSATGVGAHRAHLQADSTRFRSVLCSDCHVVPTELNSQGHIDDANNQAELSFGGIASARGVSPEYVDGTCANTYCHGATMEGGALTVPAWTAVDGQASACGACHGLPPPSPHPAATNCGQCHPNVTPGEEPAFLDSSSHIDGVVDIAIGRQACDSCHGEGGQAAPPKDLLGNTEPNSPGVGAHRAHLEASANYRALPCSTCHIVPRNVEDPEHIDGDSRAENVFTALNGLASYDRNTFTCGNLYCHGNGQSLSGPVSWTANQPVNCGSCHTTGVGLSGAHGDHVEDGIRCADCHQTVADAQRNIVDGELHMNGTKDISFSRGGEYDAQTSTCSSIGCHADWQWSGEDDG